MASPRYTFSLHVLSAALLLHTVIAVDPLFHFCSKESGNFTANSYYEQNLNDLIGNLYLKTPPTGFGRGSAGQDTDPAYGLALCRADVSGKDCKTCVVEASNEIRKRCPKNKGAILWYDNCMLKYTDSDFFGRIDNQNKFYMWNLRNVKNPEPFNTKVKELLGQLSERAFVSPKMYASGEFEYSETGKLFGMVQCSRDLSGVDCRKCIDGAISELPACCNGKEGGRVVGGSCNIRYEIYPFLKA